MKDNRSNQIKVFIIRKIVDHPITHKRVKVYLQDPTIGYASTSLSRTSTFSWDYDPNLATMMIFESRSDAENYVKTVMQHNCSIKNVRICSIKIDDPEYISIHHIGGQ
jgi:hypothetical protein